MKIKCIAIDDEPPALAQMQSYIGKVPFLELLGAFDNGIEPLQYLRENPVDLIFLDIEMDDFTGIQLLKTLRQRPNVILTTAYESYALEAFELDVTDYLLKPISFERFLHAVNKVAATMQHQPAPVKNTDLSLHKAEEKRNYIFVKTEFRMQRIDFCDILYIKGMKEYLQIITCKEKIMTLQSFKRMEELLPTTNFIRVHKSYMVALDKIKSIERNRIIIENERIPISETYRKTFYETLEKRQLM